MKPFSVSTSLATSSKRLLIAIGVLRPEHSFHRSCFRRVGAAIPGCPYRGHCSRILIPWSFTVKLRKRMIACGDPHDAMQGEGETWWPTGSSPAREQDRKIGRAHV